MASKALDEQLPKMQNVWKGGGADTDWAFKGFLDDITSTENASGQRDQRLEVLRKGNKVDFLRSSPSGTVRRFLPTWRKIRSFMRAPPAS
jgi:hypothetical protein